MSNTPHKDNGDASGAIPGSKARCLSPAEFFAATRPNHDDPADVLGPDFGLTTVELQTIPSTGIRLMNQEFWSPELDDLVTPRAQEPRRRFVARFDYAALAVGGLDWIKVYEVDRHGRFRFLLDCPNKEVIRDQVSVADVARRRRAKERALLSKRGNSELELDSIRRGKAAKDRLLEEQMARERLRNNKREVPRVASPVGVEQDASSSEMEDLVTGAKPTGDVHSSRDEKEVSEASGSVGGDDSSTSIEDLLGGTSDSGFEEE